jgi:hypothetical protein
VQIHGSLNRIEGTVTEVAVESDVEERLGPPKGKVTHGSLKHTPTLVLFGHSGLVDHGKGRLQRKRSQGQQSCLLQSDEKSVLNEGETYMQ